MNIKIGDKVRIKTEEELLAEGIIVDKRKIKMKDSDFTMDVVEVDDTYNTFYNGTYWNPISAIAEVIPQTLDEYICSLPLEERAKWFIEEIFIRLDDDVGSLNTNYHSILTNHNYFTYDEALQATIEALKQPKE